MRHVRFRDPAGAVRTGEWLDDGDHVEIDVESVGTLEHDVRRV